LGFSGEDFNQLWFPISAERGNGRGPTWVSKGFGKGPTWTCMTSVAGYDNWPGHEPARNWQMASLKALAALKEANLGYKVNPEEWCVGWSDFYYVPKYLFADYILLSAFFGAFDAFQEVAIPTIMHIIDNSRRQHPTKGLVEHFPDCFGGCCSSLAKAEDILQHRCGHKLNYQDHDLVQVHYDRLDLEAETLGARVNETEWINTVARTIKLIGSFTDGTRQAIDRMYAGFTEDQNIEMPVEGPVFTVDVEESVKRVEELIGGIGMRELKEIEWT
jgi:hypothetical protein